MKDQNILHIVSNLKIDLHAIHNDWEILLKQDAMLKDPKFLEKVATDIKKLDKDATLAVKIFELKESADIIHYVLSTPWGAPFIGKTTLLEAAKGYQIENPESALMHLLEDFLKYGHGKKAPLFNVLDELTDELTSAFPQNK